MRPRIEDFFGVETVWCWEKLDRGFVVLILRVIRLTKDNRHMATAVWPAVSAAELEIEEKRALV